MFLAPFIVLMFGAGIAIYSNITSLVGIHVHIAEVSGFMTFLGWVVFYAVAVFTFSAMYKFIPATKVKYKYALKAALVGALVFVVFQYLYLETQVFVARLNTVYGVLAAIPLFLIWLNFSWQIIIYGAQLTYSFQNVNIYGLKEYHR